VNTLPQLRDVKNIVNVGQIRRHLDLVRYSIYYY